MEWSAIILNFELYILNYMPSFKIQNTTFKITSVVFFHKQGLFRKKATAFCLAHFIYYPVVGDVCTRLKKIYFFKGIGEADFKIRDDFSFIF
jgi:hypothetical protein